MEIDTVSTRMQLIIGTMRIGLELASTDAFLPEVGYKLRIQVLPYYMGCMDNVAVGRPDVYRAA